MTYPGGRPNSSWYTYQTVGSGLRDLGRMLYQQQRDKIGDQRYEDERAREAMARRSEDLSRPGASSFAPWLQGSLQRDAAAGLPGGSSPTAADVAAEVPPIDISNIANAAAPSAPIEFRPPDTRSVPLPPVGGVERDPIQFQPPSPYMTPEGVVMDPEMGRQAQMGQIAEEELFRQSMQPEVPLPPRNIDPLSTEGLAAKRQALEDEFKLREQYGVIQDPDEPKPPTPADRLKFYESLKTAYSEWNGEIWTGYREGITEQWLLDAAQAAAEGKPLPMTPSGKATELSIDKMKNRQFPVGATGGGAYFDMTSRSGGTAPDRQVLIRPPPIATSGQKQEIPQARFDAMVTHAMTTRGITKQEAINHVGSMFAVKKEVSDTIPASPISR